MDLLVSPSSSHRTVRPSSGVRRDNSTLVGLRLTDPMEGPIPSGWGRGHRSLGRLVDQRKWTWTMRTWKT